MSLPLVGFPFAKGPTQDLYLPIEHMALGAGAIVLIGRALYDWLCVRRRRRGRKLEPGHGQILRKGTICLLERRQSAFLLSCSKELSQDSFQKPFLAGSFRGSLRKSKIWNRII